MSHELTLQELAEFSANFNVDPKNQVIARAAARSGVLEASYNERVAGRLTRVFSTELPTDNVTNQKQSGRCWLFSTLNVLRHDFGAKHKAKNFTLVYIKAHIKKHLLAGLSAQKAVSCVMSAEIFNFKHWFRHLPVSSRKPPPPASLCTHAEDC